MKKYLRIDHFKSEEFWINLNIFKIEIDLKLKNEIRTMRIDLKSLKMIMVSATKKQNIVQTLPKYLKLEECKDVVLHMK